MTNEEAVKWLENLIDDIGQTRGMYLWPYAQALQEITSMLEDRGAAQKWISVKDRTPDMQEDYLVVRNAPTRAVTLAWYSGENG